MRFQLLPGILFSLILGCDSDNHYHRIVGEWTIVSIESRAEPLVLDEVLESKDVNFTGDGDYQLGMTTSGVEGNWKLRGNFLQLIQPEIKDLKGKVLLEQVLHEWELTLAEEWMIWRGTALNDTQHLKILLHKKGNQDEMADQL